MLRLAVDGVATSTVAASSSLTTTLWPRSLGVFLQDQYMLARTLTQLRQGTQVHNKIVRLGKKLGHATYG